MLFPLAAGFEFVGSDPRFLVPGKHRAGVLDGEVLDRPAADGPVRPLGGDDHLVAHVPGRTPVLADDGQERRRVAAGGEFVEALEQAHTNDFTSSVTTSSTTRS